LLKRDRKIENIKNGKREKEMQNKEKKLENQLRFRKNKIAGNIDRKRNE